MRLYNYHEASDSRNVFEIETEFENINVQMADARHTGSTMPPTPFSIT